MVLHTDWGCIPYNYFAVAFVVVGVNGLLFNKPGVAWAVLKRRYYLGPSFGEDLPLESFKCSHAYTVKR